jgi:PAS domain S-box-containing protein
MSSQEAYLLLGLSAILGALAGLVTFALMRAVSAARDVGRTLRADRGADALVSGAVEEALRRLRSQERAMSARAEASERLSAQIIAELSSGLLVADAQGRIETLNPAGRRLLGVPEADQVERLRDLPPSAAPLVEVVEECLAARRPIVRRALRMPAGGAACLGVTVSPMHGDSGTVPGAICLFSDLSAVVELEEQLRLKDGLARLGELTAGLAHEFRNGLATIHGYSRLIDLERIPAEYRACVEGIRAETDALGEIVTNFLNFARPADLTLAPVDMRALADRAAEEIRRDVEARAGHVRVVGDFARVIGDEVLLRQALSNLCRNAVEACTDAGRPPEIHLEGAVDRAAGVFRLTVADNGPGIDAALGDRIFQPFVTGRARGTGLGLALVQKIVVTHNGRVAVGRSALGGAAFSMTLPLEPPASTPVT